MTEEEKEILHYLEGAIDTYIEGTKVTKVEMSVKDDEILLNYIDKLQKENENLKELLELTRCDLHNSWSIEKGRKKENKEKDKVIDLMAEYLNENNREFWADDIEETKQYFYKKVEEEK